MATFRQKKLAKAVVENLTAEDPLNKQELLESVGYPHSTATTYPSAVLEQKGVQEELKALGFNEDTAKQVVGEILLDPNVEPQHRIKAASEVFKVTGAYAPEKRVTLNLDGELTEREQEVARQLLQAQRD